MTKIVIPAEIATTAAYAKIEAFSPRLNVRLLINRADIAHPPNQQLIMHMSQNMGDMTVLKLTGFY
jgi:hypothetical protein